MNLLQGLSDFWLRYFADYPLLERFFSGSMALMEAAYLRLLESVLTLSLRDTPVFRKEFFSLLTICKDDIFSHGTQFAFDLTNSKIRDFTFLYNKILEPTVILEKSLDFTISTTDNKTYLLFKKHPFLWESGQPIPGVGYSVIDGKEYLAFWVPNVAFDAADLYTHYGYLVDHYAPSSAAYKAFLEGLFFYYTVGGPKVPYVTSMLNIIVGLPVTRSNELLVGVETKGSERIVVTDQNRYNFHIQVPLRDDITNSNNWGKLRLQVFEPLSAVFAVYDKWTHPTWFHNATVSPRLAPTEPYDRRHATTALYENKIDVPSGLVKVGDPGFYIGADDDGYVPTTRPAFRHNYGFCVLRIIGQNVIYAIAQTNVLVEGIIPFTDFAQGVLGNIIPGKPVYTFFSDLLPIDSSEQFLAEERLTLDIQHRGAESISQDAAFLSIGSAWKLGDYYMYVSGALTIKRHNEAPPLSYPNAEGKIPLYVGMESVIISSEKQLKDMPLEIKRHG